VQKDNCLRLGAAFAYAGSAASRRSRPRVLDAAPDRLLLIVSLGAGAAVSALPEQIGKLFPGALVTAPRLARSSRRWIYYSSQLLFFGAEFTQVYARRYGSLRSESRM